MSFDQIFIFEMRNVLFLRNGKYDEDLTKVIRKRGQCTFQPTVGSSSVGGIFSAERTSPHSRERERERNREEKGKKRS